MVRAARLVRLFRAILLGTLKPAFQPDGTPTDIVAEFYKDHSNDPDTNDKVILDPFMGGGTTVVEALQGLDRLSSRASPRRFSIPARL